MHATRAGDSVIAVIARLTGLSSPNSVATFPGNDFAAGRDWINSFALSKVICNPDTS